jgi:predicted transglutaminase-like cysteine proteinase
MLSRKNLKRIKLFCNIKMPLTIKKILALSMLLFLTSSLTGCIFEDIIGGTSFSLIGYKIDNDDGFPAVSLNFTCSGTVTIKIFGQNNDLIDSDLFFKGEHNTDLSLGAYRETITAGSYKMKAYDISGKEIYSYTFTFRGPDLEILSFLQKWWKKDTIFDSNSLFELRMYVYNNGDVPVYPYNMQAILDSKPFVGLVFPCIIMPKESEYVKCFLYKDSTPHNQSFIINLSDIDENILASKSYTVNTNNKVQTKQFSWNYFGPRRITIPIPEYLYEYHSEIERTNNNDYSLYVFDPYDDEYIDIILESIMSEFSGTKIKNINYIASFVQAIEYKSDSEDNDSFEYPRYPLETLYDNQGDCEDKAILTASLLYGLGYDIALLRLPNHMAVGVKLGEEEIPNYDFYIEDYYFLETTTKGNNCGFIPHEYRQYNESATIYPISERPLLLHDWKDGTITIYTSSELGDFVKVKTIVENLGVTTARNVMVEGAFISQSGDRENYESATILELEPNEKKKISLSIDIPKNTITQFKTRIYLDGEIVDEQESVSTFPQDF